MLSNKGRSSSDPKGAQKHVADTTLLNENVSGVWTYVKKSFRLLAPYWESPETRIRAWTYVIVLVTIELTQLGLAARLSFAMADMMDVLDLREFSAFWEAFRLWLGLMLVVMIMYALQFHIQMHLHIDWREYLTKKYTKKYLEDGLFHQMELTPYGVDNPDQRIAVDIYHVAADTFNFIFSLVSNVGNAIVFGAILWSVSGALSFAIGETGFVIPGYMFWTAVAFSIGAMWLADKIGRPLIGLTYQQQAVEADFRYHLIRLRENSESIALLGGEAREQQESAERFEQIRVNWLELLKFKLRLMLLNIGLVRASSIFPYLAAMPALVTGTIALGGFIQLKDAWTQLQQSLSWFSSSYAGLANSKANLDRLLLLEEGIQQAGRDKNSALIEHCHGANSQFAVQGLTLSLPNGEELLHDVSFDLVAGENVIVTGMTGSGKSTLFRVLSGHWSWGSGKIVHPSGEVMFLPQKPYLPIGKLRDAFAYPASTAHLNDGDLKAHLHACSLGDFAERLDETGDWARTLSGGEQQRLSLVRALIAKPSWLFLDEATSAMDSNTEASVYAAIKSNLPDTTLVSIAHRESLKSFHAKELKMSRELKSLEVDSLATPTS